MVTVVTFPIKKPEGTAMSKNNNDSENIDKDSIKPQYKKSTFENYKKHMRNRGGPDASPIQNIMGKTFNKLNIDQKIKEYKIFKIWTNAVGPLIAKKTQPKTIINKKLFVNVSTPTWVTELMYQREEILERINKEIPDGNLEEIVFRQGNINMGEDEELAGNKITISDRELTIDEKKQIEEETKDIKAKELKELIARTMGKSFKRID